MAAVLGAVIVLAGLMLWQDRVPGDDVAAGATTSTTAAAATPTTAGDSGTTATSTLPSTTPTTAGAAPSSTIDPAGVQPIACPSGVEPTICDAAAYVQQARQRQFKEFPPVEVLADSEFDQALLADFETYRAELDDEGVLLTALGLLDPGTSLADAYRDALEIGVVGFYDPETGRLVVRASADGTLGNLNLYMRQTLVHELTHALDDQWFDLDREDFADGDAEYGFTAVVEGNARRVDQRWQDGLDAASRSQLEAESMSALSPDDLLRYFTLPPILQQLQLSPYTDGLAYMKQLTASGGEAAADAALTSPPATSEEILHPGLSRATDPVVTVPRPPAGGTAVDDGRLGELLVDQWLGSTAGDGWGGDRYVTWRDGSRSCVAVDLAADTPDDLAQMQTAAQSWAAEAAADRSATTATADGRSVVRATGCA
ncbi:MAG: hypothetical protein R2761_13135 [Acidimicrobiales bacterium]